MPYRAQHKQSCCAWPCIWLVPHAQWPDANVTVWDTDTVAVTDTGTAMVMVRSASAGIAMGVDAGAGLAYNPGPSQPAPPVHRTRKAAQLGAPTAPTSGAAPARGIERAGCCAGRLGVAQVRWVISAYGPGWTSHSCRDLMLP